MKPRLLLLSSSLVLAACASDPSAAPSPSASSSAPASAAPVAVASARGPTPARLDPAVDALVKPILACVFEDHRFRSCEALDAWKKRDALKGAASDDAVLALVDDPDEKLRAVGIERELSEPVKIFAVRENAERVLAHVERGDANESVRNVLARWLGAADVEALGLTDRVRAVVTKGDVKMRHALGYQLLAYSTSTQTHALKDTPLGFALVGGLLDDPEAEVRSAAAMGLSNTAVFGASPACPYLSAAVDKGTFDVLWSASSARCEGLGAKVLAQIDGHTKQAKDIVNAVGIQYAQAVANVCGDGAKPSPALKAKGLELARRMVAPGVPDPNTRRSAERALVACDPVAAKGDLAKLAKDPESFVAKGAEEQLASLAKKK